MNGRDGKIARLSPHVLSCYQSMSVPVITQYKLYTSANNMT